MSPIQTRSATEETRRIAAHFHCTKQLRSDSFPSSQPQIRADGRIVRKGLHQQPLSSAVTLVHAEFLETLRHLKANSI